MSRTRATTLALLALTGVAVAVTYSVHPYAEWPAQDPRYHHFADTRTLLGIANFWNVASNLPFLPIGIAGIVWAWRRRALRPLVLFGGVALTCFGSGYYHYAPSSDALFWDRLPMTLVFMPLFSELVSETIDARAGSRLFAPLVALGVASVVYWTLTERSGHGDLRPYAIIQFLPLAAIPLLLAVGRPPSLGAWLHVVGWYVAAKIVEVTDARIYATLSAGMSGHAIKHVFAAAATFAIYRLYVSKKATTAA